MSSSSKEQVDIGSLTWDSYIYPRQNINKRTIEAYSESASIGAEFPPLVVQKVTDYITDSNGDIIAEALLIIDGVHRWHAYQECKRKQVEVSYLQTEALDYRSARSELALSSAERNTRHGDRISDSDKKEVARRIAADDPEQKWTYEILAERLHSSTGSISGWISDIRTRQKAGRNAVILRLERLGWSQAEIGEVVDLTGQAVGKIETNFNSEDIFNLLAEGRDMAYIADLFSLDMALAWALRMEGKSDQEKFKELEWGLRTWDLWNFNACDERFGDDWPGRIPAQLVAHTLYFFTNPGDLVLDPMAGGGVVPDVCLLFGRKCRAFDLSTRPSRLEIQNHYWQLGAMQWPDVKKANLIFFDPPYFTKKEKEYEEKSNGPTPISSLGRDGYLAFFKEFMALALEHMKPGAHIAFLNADWRDFQSTAALKEKVNGAVTVFDYHSLLSENGWQVTHRIECPMSTQRMSGNTVENMQNGRILGTVGRTLLVAKKEA